MGAAAPATLPCIVSPKMLSIGANMFELPTVGITIRRKFSIRQMFTLPATHTKKPTGFNLIKITLSGRPTPTATGFIFSHSPGHTPAISTPYAAATMATTTRTTRFIQMMSTWILATSIWISASFSRISGSHITTTPGLVDAAQGEERHYRAGDAYAPYGEPEHRPAYGSSRSSVVPRIRISSIATAARI